ncbi:MAG: double-strand break repair helicase AddA [Proteobacteria bacterium]|nr:double-strand break repair helicase AddA [Pseudomonadota bacterium]
MSKPLTIPPDVIALQTSASDPAQSAWVSANAGSGKTHVLAQRVIRLLLNGTDPARILCITFTKAAAANMANRVFDVLRGWTVLDDTALDAAILRTGVKSITPALRLRARQLFALALDTPGGLKVQTIHAFCTQLLHLFPFEANVPARFEVLDEATEHQLLHDLTMDVLLEAAEKPDTALGRALAQAVLAAADQTFQDMIRNAIGERDPLTRWIEAAGGVEGARAQLSRVLGIAPDDTVEAADAAMFGASLFAENEWAGIAGVFDTGSANDHKQAARIRALSGLDMPKRVDRYLDIFCNSDRDKTRDNVMTGKLGKAHPELCERLTRERDRVWDLLTRKRAIEARDRSMALFTIAHAVIVRFRKEKDRRGLLDYDDLIDKTLELLTEASAAWVHYKLDSGIHHVLIDEAQDTSPKQWAIVERLVSEFFAGKGAHERARTIFAVGDEKQSIFSFQGADPKEFASNRLHFKMLHERADLAFEGIEFKTSFRSGANVLGAVDVVFKSETAHAGLSADNVGPVHQSLPDKAPGLVELWDLTEADLIDKKPGWDAPFDLQTARSAPAKLADRIAGTVAAWRGQGRAPKDVLILVRQRGPLFEAIIRALKQAGVPVAGADRLVLTQHIAVMDLMVLADALLLPEDDLALATILKSPLFGLSDAALEKLAWNRGRASLYASLRTNEPQLAARFDTMQARARDLSPFAFYAWLLGAHDGRRQFLSRLGHEAADALDEFLNLALDYETRETPTLQGFVAWLRVAEAEVKRDMEMERDEVRVMTVHGAKGLEAPFVILADTTTRPEGAIPPKLLTLTPVEAPSGAPAPMVWAGRKASDNAAMTTARDAVLRDATDEYRRLLYVAMTRAAERLVVCGLKGDKKIPDGCWYQLVDNALADLTVRENADDGVGDGEGTVRRFRKTDPFASSVSQTEQSNATTRNAAPPPAVVPDWLRYDAPRDTTVRAITPSGFDESAPRPLPPPGQNKAMLRGSLTHRLLQSLPGIPPERRVKAAGDYLARAASDLSGADHAKLIADVLRVLDDARFGALFGPGSRAEVPIVGLVEVDGETRRVNGQVDRLVVTPDWVLIADYKTNRPAPASLAAAESTYPQYIRQLSLYRAVLAKLYPGRGIRCALIWTEVPDLMELSDEAIAHARATVTSAR